MNVEAQEVVVAVFLCFGCNCHGPNPKYEKMIKKNGTVRYRYQDFFSKFSPNIQYSGSSSMVFYSVGVLNQEK